MFFIYHDRGIVAGCLLAIRRCSFVNNRIKRPHSERTSGLYVIQDMYTFLRLYIFTWLKLIYISYDFTYIYIYVQTDVKDLYLWPNIIYIHYSTIRVNQTKREQEKNKKRLYVYTNYLSLTLFMIHLKWAFIGKEKGLTFFGII